MPISFGTTILMKPSCILLVVIAACVAIPLPTTSQRSTFGLFLLAPPMMAGQWRKPVTKTFHPPSPDGDAFTFAEQHYNLSGDGLLAKLEEELHLHRKDVSTENEKTEFSVFSFFRAPISNTQPHKSITLLDAYHYLIGHFARQRTLTLRSLSDAQQARRFKASNFDYCCFSGIFSKRNDNALIRHSGLMCIDFDHLPDPDDLFRRLLLDDYFDTQLLFRSPSGDGLKWIIPIDLAEYTHGDYFQAVAAYILQRYSVQIDKSGRDISRACFLPYDPNAFLNPKILHQ